MNMYLERILRLNFMTVWTVYSEYVLVQSGRTLHGIRSTPSTQNTFWHSLVVPYGVLQ
jgi:hypothetical protein